VTADNDTARAARCGEDTLLDLALQAIDNLSGLRSISRIPGET